MTKGLRQACWGGSWYILARRCVLWSVEYRALNRRTWEPCAKARREPSGETAITACFILNCDPGRMHLPNAHCRRDIFSICE
eukprot:1368154-Amorphochlora_amoeboformis.AAC.2